MIAEYQAAEIEFQPGDARFVERGNRAAQSNSRSTGPPPMQPVCATLCFGPCLVIAPRRWRTKVRRSGLGFGEVLQVDRVEERLGLGQPFIVGIFVATPILDRRLAATQQAGSQRSYHSMAAVAEAIESR